MQENDLQQDINQLRIFNTLDEIIKVQEKVLQNIYDNNN